VGVADEVCMDFATSDIQVLAGLIACGIAWQFFFLVCLAVFEPVLAFVKTFSGKL
jgi:hypothetical protein